MTSEPSVNEFLLKDPPKDTISSAKFGPTSSNFLFVTSWDHTARLYDVGTNTQRSCYENINALLDCTFVDPTHGYVGGLEGKLSGYDFNTSVETFLGFHNAPIKCVEFCPELGILITGSWDCTVKLWDPRQSKCIDTHDQDERVYTMALSEERLVVGTAERRVMVWDLRNTGVVQQKRESSLKFQTRCIRCFPNKQGYVLSSIEGRVAVEYFDPSPEVQKKKYAFKCHRVKNDGTEYVYPVNTIAFHNGYNTFATGGSDGFVNVWDGFHKKRLCQFHRYQSSISSLSFSNDGTVLAIAVSYLNEEGEREHPEDAIFIRQVSDAETKPK
ncbi:mitotic checkpoint protein BUB3 isoform X1 [Hydra vulgaris]|nr:mitotic checkpoint protein BUB3 [Hydra vulgaris]